VQFGKAELPRSFASQNSTQQMPLEFAVGKLQRKSRRLLRPQRGLRLDNIGAKGQNDTQR
jgi:hypothetical protein